MASSPVCSKCQSLLFQPETSMPTVGAPEYSETTDFISYDRSDVIPSANNGCRMCVLLLRLLNRSFPSLVGIRRRSPTEGSRTDRLTVVAKRLMNNGSVARDWSMFLQLEPASTSSEVMDTKLNYLADTCGYSSLPVVPFSPGLAENKRHDACVRNIEDWLSICELQHHNCQKPTYTNIGHGQDHFLPASLALVLMDRHVWSPKLK